MLATPESDAVEVGVAFSTAVPGTVTAINFYKGPGNGGAHVGHIWSTGGVALATVDFAAETESGWQTAALSTPLTLVPGEKYIVSYLAPQGHYSYTSRYFQTAKTTGPLTAPAAGTGPAGNGLFAYGPNGGFPQATYGATNYFVDVSFTPTTP